MSTKSCANTMQVKLIREKHPPMQKLCINSLYSLSYTLSMGHEKSW